MTTLEELGFKQVFLCWTRPIKETFFLLNALLVSQSAFHVMKESPLMQNGCTVLNSLGKKGCLCVSFFLRNVSIPYRGTA